MDSSVHTPYAHDLKWPEGLKPFDAWNVSIQAEPFSHYAWLRDHAPVMRAKTPSGDIWFLSRYADVLSALRAPKIFSSVLAEKARMPVMLFLDPPEHTRLRQIVASTFAPKSVARLEDRIRQKTADRFSSFLSSGRLDFVDGFAAPLTMTVITELLGLPVPDISLLRRWTYQFTSYFGRISGRSPGSPGDEEDARAFLSYMTDALRTAPDDGALLGVLAGHWRSGVLTEEEAAYFGVMLFTAGHDTTTILMSNALMLLAARPDLHARLRERSADIPFFIEEVARYRGTLQRLARKTLQDVHVAGHFIPAGSSVRLLIGSANRDSAKFPNGEVFNIDRDASGHLGFGFGVHACLGAWLARLEGRLAFETITQTVTRIELDGADAITPYAGGTMSNTGPEILNVRFEAP